MFNTAFDGTANLSNVAFLAAALNLGASSVNREGGLSSAPVCRCYNSLKGEGKNFTRFVKCKNQTPPLSLVYSTLMDAHC
jgi:hypothetical protein